MFSFDNINRSRDGDTLSCRCVVAADMPCFDGHFPGIPVMPAAAQIGMLQALLQQQSDWNAVITGGSGLKFSGRIQPGATLTLRLQRSSRGDIRFSVEHQTSVVSKGVLLTGGTLD